MEDELQNGSEFQEKDEISAAESLYLESRRPDEPKARRPKKSADKALREMTRDADLPRSSFSFRRILGGDILQSEWLRRQIGLIVLVVALMIVYIGNRYASQQEMIKIDELKQKLTDVKYDALTRSSELLEKTRRSKIEEYLRQSKDSTLQTALVPPIVIETN